MSGLGVGQGGAHRLWSSWKGQPGPRLGLGWAGDGGGDGHQPHRCVCPQVSHLTWFTRHDPVVRKEPPAAPLPPTLPQKEAGDTDTQREGAEGSACEPPRGELLPLGDSAFEGTSLPQITSTTGAAAGGARAPLAPESSGSGSPHTDGGRRSLPAAQAPRAGGTAGTAGCRPVSAGGFRSAQLPPREMRVRVLQCPHVWPGSPGVRRPSAAAVPSGPYCLRARGCGCQ